MKSPHINFRSSVYSCFILIVSFFSVCGCSAAKQKKCLVNKNIPSYQQKLLEKAFESASAIPLNPHIKDRSRFQQEVVNAAIKLEQPVLASEYTQQIENWRRNLSYAELAVFCAEKKLQKQARSYIEQASQLPEDINQQWRIERVNAEITKAKNILNTDKLSTVTTTEDQPADPNLSQFKELSAAYDEMLNSEKPQENGRALKGYSNLFSRYYKNSNLRSDAERKVLSNFDKIPLYMRVELLIEMSGAAFDNDDNKKAIDLLDQTKPLIKLNKWPLKYFLSVKFRAGDLYHKAENNKKAISIIDSALSDYNKRYEEITDIYRAELLIPFAELYIKTGNLGKAKDTYKLAVEASIANPNSRPRAEDISSICCSMAVSACKPEQELFKRIKDIIGRFSAPW